MKKILYTTVLALIIGSAFGQTGLTLYNFNALPQSLQLNPAQPQQAKVWVGLPALSGVMVNFHNSGFQLVDLFREGESANTSFNKIANNLDSRSHISVQEELELLGVGFKIKNGFFSMGAIQKFDYRMDYPADLLRFIAYDSASSSVPQQTLDMSEFDFETTARIDFYVGYQHTFNDKLTVGGRFKYIVGLAHTYAERSKAVFDMTDPWNSKVETDILFHTAGVSGWMDSLAANPSKHAFSPNRGYGIDIGAYYKFNEKFSASISVLDIGQIKWDTYTRDHISKGEYNYEGMQVDLSDDDGFGTASDAIGDSLAAALNFYEEEGASYKRSLMKRIYLGANYHLTEKHAIGILYHGKAWEGELYHDFSANYQGRWFRGVQLLASYSVVNGTYNNVGAGIQLKLGPMQLYVISDNIFGAIMYETLQTTSLRAGLNITFFGKKDKKLGKDVQEPISSPYMDVPSENDEIPVGETPEEDQDQDEN